jgi:hypothetical protein
VLRRSKRGGAIAPFVSRALAAGALVTVLAASAARPAAAQTARQTANEVELSRIFAGLPALLERVTAKGYTEFFRLLETLELFRFEAEIDRFVGRPRELNDTTSYKLSLLPFYISYPIYQPLVAQMTRLDTVRANRIYTVTPSSVSLVDLRLTPVRFIEEFNGLGRGDDIARSLLTHFSAREISDLTVLLLAQYPFFPQTDEEWQHTKHRVARAAVPIALGALATGAFFDAGALTYSAPIARHNNDFELRYYGAFRGLGIHWHPYVRGGMAARAYGFEASAGLADQVNPTTSEPDRAVELALREGWLNQLVQPLGLDAFFEAALKRSIGEPAGFVGDLTTARSGFFFKREQAPLFPDLAMRGSIEAESNLEHRLHFVTALGFEKPNSGITTILQASLVPSPPGSGVPDDARLNLFFVGSMEPLSQSFTDDMTSLARQCEEQLAGLEALEKRREDWEQALLARGTSGRPPQEQRAMLAEIEQILVEREQRTVRLAGDLADYLESRRRAYSILNRGRSPDDLHGPLAAAELIAARNLVLARLENLSAELARAQGPLAALKDRLTTLRREIEELEATDPDGTRLAIRRQGLAALEQQWDEETERIRRYLAARDQLHADGVRILTAMGRSETDIRRWDTLGALVRTRIARLAITAPP